MQIHLRIDHPINKHFRTTVAYSSVSISVANYVYPFISFSQQTLRSPPEVRHRFCTLWTTGQGDIVAAKRTLFQNFENYQKHFAVQRRS